MQVAAIMPCRGRAEQTVANVRRLLTTANYDQWQLICVAHEPEVWKSLRAMGEYTPHQVLAHQAPVTYWQGMIYGMKAFWDATHLMCLANDLWSCDDWLKLAVEEYRHHFGSGEGLLGFAGDGHGWSHSCHFLISRGLLDRYGGWPVWYQHNFGDAELCQRARNDGCYWKSTQATIEHCHVERGLAPDDAVYQAGRATYRQDEALFAERRRLGWPRVSR